MSALSDILETLRLPDARVLAMDPTGGQTVPLPGEFAATGAITMQSETPLDPIDAADHGHAVVAFEAARRRGRGSASVSLCDVSGPQRLHIFDLEQSHGCFLAITVPDTQSAEGFDSVSSLGVRQGSYQLSATGLFQRVSPEFELLLGWSGDELLGRSCLDLVHPDDHENGIHGWIELLERPNEKCRMRQRFLMKSGEWMWCEVTDTNNLSDGTDPHVLGEIVDVSRELAAQTALQRRETLLDRLTNALPSGVLHIDDTGSVEVFNDRWTDLTGLDASAGIGGLLEIVTSPEVLQNAVADSEDRGVDVDIEITFAESASGACRFGHLHVRPLDDGAGLLLTLDDMTSFRAHQQELADRAMRDALTGICNRLGLERAVQQALSHRSPAPGRIALFLDLDRFKSINDRHGHAAGDAVLCHVADELTRLAEGEDVVGRLGGDEFLVLLVGDDALDRSTAFCAKIERAVDEIGEVIPEAVGAGVSIGLARARPEDDFDSLLRRADEAMYEVKRARRGAEELANRAA